MGGKSTWRRKKKKINELKSEAVDNRKKSLQGSGDKLEDIILEVVDLDKLEE